MLIYKSKQVAKSESTELSSMWAEVSWPFLFFVAVLAHSSFLNNLTLISLLTYLVYKCRKANLKYYFFECFPKYQFMFWFQLYALLSVFWSDVPNVTFSLSIKLLLEFIVVFFIAIFFIEYDKDIAKTLRVVCLTLTAAVVGYVIMFPGKSIGYSGFQAFFDHKNALGLSTCICTFTFFLGSGRTKIDYCFGAISLIILYLTQSKTSINLFLMISASMIITAVIIKNLEHQTELVKLYASIFTKVISGLYLSLIALIVFYRQEITDYLIHNMTDELLTGRGKLWKGVLKRVSDDTFLGVGVGSMWGAEGKSDIVLSPIYAEEWIRKLMKADGGYIDLIGSLGFLGIALMMLTYYQFMKNADHKKLQKQYFYLVSLTLFAVFHNITESDIYKYADPLWHFYVLFFIYVAILPQKIVSKPVIS